jgi:hypothetical protein
MRKLALTIGILGAIGIWVVSNQDKEQPATVTMEPMEAVDSPLVESSTSVQIDERQSSTVRVESVAEPAEVVVVDEQKLQAGHDELKTLIDEYNQHLGDREKRAEIEQQVATVAESYKLEVLAKVKSLK